MNSSPLKIARLFFFAGLAGATAVNAATITAVQNDKNWDLGTTWSDGQAPAPGNDYVVGGDGTNISIRTNGDTFQGNSLTFVHNGSFFKVGGGTGNPTANVYFNGNTTLEVLSNGVTLEGSLSIANGVTVRTNSTSNKRAITIASIISGSGTFSTARLDGTTPVNASNGVTFTADNSSFTGHWELNAPSFFTAANSLGSFSSITINGLSGARLDANYDVSRASASLIINSAQSLNPSDNGKIVLDQNFTFGSVTIGGTALSAGTYTASDLVGLGYEAYIVSGAGSLTVAPIPEPGSATLLGGLAAAGFIAFRRRRSSR